jgi:hypothetical protein
MALKQVVDFIKLSMFWIFKTKFVYFPTAHDVPLTFWVLDNKLKSVLVIFAKLHSDFATHLSWTAETSSAHLINVGRMLNLYQASRTVLKLKYS